MAQRSQRVKVRHVVGVTAGASAFLFAVYALARVSDVSITALVRDSNQTTGAEWYVGSVALLTVLVWFGSSLTAFAASFRAAEGHAQFLRSFGCFGMTLALDDAFLLHERVLPTLFGSGAERLLFAAYASIAMWLALQHRTRLSGNAMAFGFVAMFGLGSSVAIDLLHLAPVYVEDAFKFVGVVAWGGLAMAQAGDAVARSARRRWGTAEPYSCDATTAINTE